MTLPQMIKKSLEKRSKRRYPLTSMEIAFVSALQKLNG